MSFRQDEIIAVLQTARVGIWSWSVADGEVRWSPEVFRLFGVEEFGGGYEDFIALVHPEDRHVVTSEIESAMANPGSTFSMHHRVVHTDGSIRWLSCSGRCVVDDAGSPTGMTGVSMDVTDRKHAKEALEEKEEALRLFSELASDYVYSVDLTRPGAATPRIVAGSFERTTGYSPEEVAELGGWENIMLPEDRDSNQAIWEEIRQGKQVVNEYRIRAKSGETRWVRDRIRPVLNPESELIGLVGGVQEISERKELEGRLLHAQKMEALARLAGGVAHDFNNLLTVIFGALSMLKLEPSNTSEHAAEIEKAAARAAELTRSLLTFGRRQVGERRAVRITDVIEGARPMMERSVGDRIELKFEFGSEDAIIEVDPSQLQLAMLNLVLNARDAMPDGGRVTVRASVDRFDSNDPRRPAELAPGDWVTFSIKDNGKGIRHEDLPHIFEPFFTTKPAGKGTGLGLATAHGVVRQLGGALTVANTPGDGACFEIHLPRSLSEPESPSLSRSRHAVGGTERILLIEDEDAVRHLCAKCLDDLGYTVVSLPSGEEALSLSDEALRAFDLVVSDVGLSGIPGTEVAHALLDRRPGLRVILMSGYVEGDAVEKLVASRRSSFLKKPFSPEALAARVREALDAK